MLDQLNLNEININIWQDIQDFNEYFILTSSSIQKLTDETNLINNFLKKISIKELIACIHQANTNKSARHIKDACNALEKILSNDTIRKEIPPSELKSLLIAGLKHNYILVKKLTLTQLHKYYTKQTITDINIDIFDVVLDTMDDEDTGIARTAADLILMLISHLQNGSGLYILLDKLEIKLKQIQVMEDTLNYLRFVELLSRLLSTDEDLAEIIINKKHYFLDFMRHGFFSGDPLVVENILESFRYFSKSKTMVAYIFKSEILQDLAKLTHDTFAGGLASIVLNELKMTAGDDLAARLIKS